MVAGGDYYSRDVYTAASTTVAYSTASDTVLRATRTLSKSCNPARFNDEKLKCTHKNPIVFALDVTGSMGNWTKIIYDKFPLFYGQIMMQGYLQDPSVSFCAIGDMVSDDAPLQITDFGQGKAIDELISKLYLEGGGGGNYKESYELSAYFYKNLVEMEPDVELPFFFFSGDEGYYPTITQKQLNLLGLSNCAADLKETVLNSEECWQQLQQKYNVFMLKKPYSDEPDADEKITASWVKTLGKEHVLMMKTPKACVDIVLGAISIVSKTRTLETYVEDMRERGQDDDRIAEVTAALTPLWDAISTNQYKLVDGKSIAAAAAAASTSVASTAAKEADAAASLSFDEAVPNEYLCPITCAIMNDPVITADGHSYERSAIAAWFEKSLLSPVTGQVLASKMMIPNNALKKLIQDWKEKHQVK